ncbi:MAG: RagB/SusD family nutrient uptake outer membrane protein [Cytophagales bacterium]|nr:RagB/SusD family nutrient uptake outer membrane protein [Cytophagales bacterium]
MKKISIIPILLLFFISSCNDDFMDRFPETSIGKENFFKSEEDLRIYVNSMYNFPTVWHYVSDAATDNATTTGNTELKTMMVSAPSSETILNGWDWEELRNINFFLENFNNNNLPVEVLNHYEGLARFFRANFYMHKVIRYSNVPWYDYTIETDDEASLLKTQDDRAMVVEKIFEDYQFAVDHIEEVQPDGAVNKWVALAYMARNALFEGTFRKYHQELNLQNTAENFLVMSRDAANALMNADYSLYNTGNVDSDYGALFSSTNLNGNPEIIFHRSYEDGLLSSDWWSFMFGNYEVSPAKDLLQSYLLADGNFYSSQQDYETKLFVEEFENRDPRLYQTYAYPGWELINTSTYSQGGGIYIQQLQKNFSGYHQIKGFVNEKEEAVANSLDIPLLRLAEILLIYAESKAELGALTQADLDITVNALRDRAGMPHMTLNPNVDPVQEARYPNIKINTQWKELLEIRRERRIELAFEGFRSNDLSRWYAGVLLENEPRGLYFPGLGKYDLTGDSIEDIILIDVSESIPESENKEENELGVKLIYYRVGFQDSDASFYLSEGNKGTITTVKDRGTFVEPKYYYRPVPATQITLNPNLNQYFGW